MTTSGNLRVQATPIFMFRKRNAFASCLMVAVLAGASYGCVYRIDLQQGNVVTQDMVNRLEPGMEQRKVLFIMGTPLITDAFDPERWDYVYTFQPGGGQRVQRRIALVFRDARLVRIEGDIEASASQAPEAGERPETVVTVPDEGQEKGFWGWFGGGDKEAQGRADTPASEPSEEAQENPAGEGLEVGAQLSDPKSAIAWQSRGAGRAA
jgi:outer membrane protein assembly factor BamE